MRQYKGGDMTLRSGCYLESCAVLTGAPQSDRADRYRVVKQIDKIESQK
jgi:hypothetical protein